MTGMLTRGETCRAFEQAFADYVGAAHAVSVSSCTAALLVTLSALGVGAGDLVLVPALTFTATAEAALTVGATPVLVDCDARNLCLDPAAVRRLLEAPLPAGARRYAAIVPVHYGGTIADLDVIEDLAAEFRLHLVHDAAHCVPSAYRPAGTAAWRRIGEVAGTACFSFYGNKCITTGEGGMITTSDPMLAARLRRISLHGGLAADQVARTGFVWDYEITDRGFKANMPDPLAALGLSQLRRADALLARRQAIAGHYRRVLGGRIAADLPEPADDRQLSWHLYVIRLRLEALDCDRDTIFRRVQDRGVTCSVHWRPLHRHTLYRRLIEQGTVLLGDCPVTDTVWPALLSLPIFPGMTADDLDYVCETLVAILGS